MLLSSSCHVLTFHAGILCYSCTFTYTIALTNYDCVDSPETVINNLVNCTHQDDKYCFIQRDWDDCKFLSHWLTPKNEPKGSTINDLGGVGRENREKKFRRPFARKKNSRGLPGQKINFKRPPRGKIKFKKALPREKKRYFPLRKKNFKHFFDCV